MNILIIIYFLVTIIFIGCENNLKKKRKEKEGWSIYCGRGRYKLYSQINGPKNLTKEKHQIQGEKLAKSARNFATEGNCRSSPKISTCFSNDPGSNSLTISNFTVIQCVLWIIFLLDLDTNSQITIWIQFYFDETFSFWIKCIERMR